MAGFLFIILTIITSHYKKNVAPNLTTAGRDTWNMDPVALEKAFELYPEVRLIIVAHLYGTPGKMEEIKRIADAHGALIVEDAAESLGAKYKLNGEWVETGTLGDYNCISFNGNNVFQPVRDAA